MQLLIPQDLQTMTHAAVSHPLPKQTSNNERSEKDLQIEAASLPKHSPRTPEPEHAKGSPCERFGQTTEIETIRNP